MLYNTENNYLTDLYDSNNYLDKMILEMRYTNWTNRQLKIEYEINQKINDFNEFRKLNLNLN